MLREPGVHVVVGLSTPQVYIHQLRPRESYTPELVDHCCLTIDALAKHDNVLGVVAANKLVNKVKPMPAAETVRAVTRDIKLYMKDRP